METSLQHLTNRNQHFRRLNPSGNGYDDLELEVVQTTKFRFQFSNQLLLQLRGARHHERYAPQLAPAEYRLEFEFGFVRHHLVLGQGSIHIKRSHHDGPTCSLNSSLYRTCCQSSHNVTLQ